MNDNTQQLVQAIHNNPIHLVLVAAGAGTQALSQLLAVGGASRTLLESLIPYSNASFNEFLGQTPKQYVSEETARLMAGRAYTRARWLLPTDEPIMGVACTATIATDRPKQGDHRAYIAIWQPENVACHYFHLEKGARDRAGEENVVSNLMLNSIATACGLSIKTTLPFNSGDMITESRYNFAGEVDALLAGKRPFFSIEDNGKIQNDGTRPGLLLSGSFNPLHDGHLEMAFTAANSLGISAAFELSVINADKPPLAQDIALKRLAQFAGRHTIYVSTAPTFVEKSRIYPGTTFIVGYDTAKRILQPHFYQNSQAQMLSSLSEIKRQGCAFLVAGRLGGNGRFHRASDLTIPPGFESLFMPIAFRKDISSTELRNADQKGSR